MRRYSAFRLVHEAASALLLQGTIEPGRWPPAGTGQGVELRRQGTGRDRGQLMKPERSVNKREAHDEAKRQDPRCQPHPVISAGAARRLAKSNGRQKGGAGRRSCRGAGAPAPITYPLASGLRCTAASLVAEVAMTLR